jgi:hypothetical protein
MDLGAEIVVGLDPGAHVVTDCVPSAGISATVLGALPSRATRICVRQIDLRRH